MSPLHQSHKQRNRLHTAALISGVFETMNASIDIMQDRITKSRLAGDPPDILISPHLAHMGWLEFDRAEEAIKAGKHAVKRALSAGAFHALLSARNLDCESYEPD